MSLLSDRIAEALDDADMSQASLARCVGVSRATVTDWVNGNTKEIRGGNLMKAAACLGVTAIWLSDGKQPKKAVQNQPDDSGSDGRYRRIPIISFVSAGAFSSASDPFPVGYGDDEVTIDTVVYPVGPRSFALRVRGDSMRDEYFSGEIIVVDPEVEPQPREPVVAKIDDDDEATFKLYVPKGKDDDGYPIIELVPINPHFDTLIINKENPGRIIGPMVTRIQGRRRH